VRDRPWLERVQNILLSVYIVVMTGVFVVYLMKTSCLRLARVVRDPDVENPCSRFCRFCTSRPARFCCSRLCRCFIDDAENPRGCGSCAPTKESNFGARIFCCLFCCCYGISRRLFCSACRNVRCSPCSCCRRPGLPACALFTRVFTRELLAAVATLSVILNEESITNQDGIQQLAALTRTTVLVLLALVAHVAGYILGAFVGRWAEAMCYICCQSCCQTFAGVYRNFQ